MLDSLIKYHWHRESLLLNLAVPEQLIAIKIRLIEKSWTKYLSCPQLPSVVENHALPIQYF